MNTNQSVETVGAIAAKDYHYAEVLKKMGIDFCCGGDKTIKEVCDETGISEERLKNALKQADVVSSATHPDFNKWELSYLTDYITDTHHRYVKENVETIIKLVKKVAQRHGESHPELLELAAGLCRFTDDLLSHMLNEEKVLFPTIKQLIAKRDDPKASVDMPLGFIKNAVKNMLTEHEISGEGLKFFRSITDNYALPADACSSYVLLFGKLKEFENDLFLHVHLENNILFPKSSLLDEMLATRL